MCLQKENCDLLKAVICAYIRALMLHAIYLLDHPFVLSPCWWGLTAGWKVIRYWQ